jgi:hypothetical protein
MMMMMKKGNKREVGAVGMDELVLKGKWSSE